jgi:hypothetical protein
VYNRNKIIGVMREIYAESKAISPYVIICQPRRNKQETAAQNFNGALGLHIDMLGFSHGFADIDGEKVDVARNYLFERALESGAKYMLFIGEDTVLPYDGFKKLMATCEANPNSVVTGVYYMKCSDAMIMVREGNWITIPNVDPGQIIEAWQTGMDAMLIPIEIIKRMKDLDPEIPFCCIGNQIDDEINFIGEDNFFVHRLHKMGVKLLVNTDVQCLHMDLASGMYTAHPSVRLENYYTNIKPTRPLTLDDKAYIDNRWSSRLPKGTGAQPAPVSKVDLNQMIQSGLPLKLNMGCGRDRIEGYVGVDQYGEGADIKIDVLDFALPENTVTEIMSSHMLEHLPHFRVPELLTTWFRMLKPGGQLILELPNLEALCEEFVTADDHRRYVLSLCIYGAFANYVNQDSIDNGVASPHLWGFYPKVLVQILETIGFESIQVLPQQGLHPGHNFRIETSKPL